MTTSQTEKRRVVELMLAGSHRQEATDYVRVNESCTFKALKAKSKKTLRKTA